MATSLSLNKSTIDTTAIKPTLDTGVKSYPKHQSYKSHILDTKRRNSLNKGIKVELQNEKFGNKLKRISSPLSRDSLNSSYSKLKEYRSIVKKVENKDEVMKKVKYVKNYLPPLLDKSKSYGSLINISKSGQMLALGKINNFRKFGY